MAFPKKHLYNDEQIILDRYPHWWYLAPRALALLATCAFGIFTLAYDFGDDSKLRNPIRYVAAGAIDHLSPKGSKQAAEKIRKVVDKNAESGDQNKIQGDYPLKQVMYRIETRAD